MKKCLGKRLELPDVRLPDIRRILIKTPFGPSAVRAKDHGRPSKSSFSCGASDGGKLLDPWLPGLRVRNVLRKRT